MERMLAVLAVCMTAVMSVASAAWAESALHFTNETPEAKSKRMKWWTDARFGMFIHFGLYALPARGEWVKTDELVTEEKYENYFQHFDPDLFDAREWARQAKRTGMRYAVMTAKHHEGFCLWDSKWTDYKVTKTPCGRDLVREYVEAFRSEGIHVGLYYSLIDWHHPDFTIDDRHPRMPPGCRPGDVTGVEGGEATWSRLNANRDMSKYRQYMKNQISELLSNYGQIDVIWYDFSYPVNGVHGKDRNDWDSKGIVELTRRLQPQIIIDNRLDLLDTTWGWDFITPEQFKVSKWPTWKGVEEPWETCQTFSGKWGYFRDTASWKSPHQLIELLVHTVSQGGNMILNVGPTARGRFDRLTVERLQAIGDWMDVNSRSVYGCTRAPSSFVAPDNTLLTYNHARNRLYLHLLSYPLGRIPIAFGEKIAYAQFLHDGSELEVKKSVPRTQQNGDSVEQVCIVLPMVKPDPEIPVIEMFLKQ